MGQVSVRRMSYWWQARKNRRCKGSDPGKKEN